MGLTKRLYEEQLERGWSSVGKYICAECCPPLKDVVAENVEETRCDNCEREADEPIAADTDVVMTHIGESFRSDYTDPANVLPRTPGAGRRPKLGQIFIGSWSPPGIDQPADSFVKVMISDDPAGPSTGRAELAAGRFQSTSRRSAKRRLSGAKRSVEQKHAERSIHDGRRDAPYWMFPRACTDEYREVSLFVGSATAGEILPRAVGRAAYPSLARPFRAGILTKGVSPSFGYCVTPPRGGVAM